LAAALAPFGVGALLASASGFPLKGLVVTVETLAVAALFVAGLASREAFAPQAGRWPPWGRLAPEAWQYLAYCCLALAGLLVILLQWVWRTGDFTIPLGAVGVLGGYFIFAPPVAWQGRGWGEFWAGLCFGLLPVASGFYLQSRHLVSEILMYGIPLSLAAFNLFLLLGFPESGQRVGPERRSLASRLGPVGAALLYTIVNILVMVGLVVNLLFPAAVSWSQSWLWALIALALVNQESIKRRAYYQEARIQLLCLLTLALHLGMSLIFALGLWERL
jgi:1,4-dihydroxy-2-naphthoate octaprenyltransferase